MNIALFSDTYYPEVNGVATSVHSLYELLKKNGHNCYVVTTSNDKFTTFKHDIIGIPGLTLKKLYGYRASLFYDEKAFDLLKSLNLDLIHINTEFGIGLFGFTVANKLNLPSVYTYHTMYEDYTYYATKGYFDRVSKWVMREISRGSIEDATELIAPSIKTEIYLRSIGVNKTINIVPTGFDFSRFKLNDEDKEKVLEIKKKYKLEDKKVLLCLGRIAKEKSYDVIIKGYKRYCDKYEDNTILVFVGDGPEVKELEELITTLGISERVLFLGKVKLDDVPLYYGIGDIFLNSSISETQGLTFMESMASNLPILCRYDKSLLNVIENRVNGLFFIDEYDFKDRLHEILSMSNKELDKMSINAYNSISEYSDISFYNKIMEVYYRAIRRSW